MACSDGESINMTTYQKLHTEISLEGLMDILEMHEVHSSWKHAASLNAEWKAALPR